ncbi:putative holliday junction resolvase [Candidatus Gastranaerophilus sp. (ex Termes propinquus)]|nr:putative holliday junction resolvase [Candidatus Gastranaerophilus sp. (ex Termes propinquus)]
MSQKLERILGLDVGTKRIGVAISDPLRVFSREVGLVLRTSDESAYFEIKKICDEYGVLEIVVGVPYNDDGSVGSQAQNCIDFAKPLESFYKVSYYDERFSSQSAEELLRKEGKKYTKNKGLVDIKSACLILQDYLSSHTD